MKDFLSKLFATVYLWVPLYIIFYIWPTMPFSIKVVITIYSMAAAFASAGFIHGTEENSGKKEGQ